jgi:hypothetical protein
MIGMSAANAAVDNIEAAPAAIRNLTLRILAFVLLPREATADASQSKTEVRGSHQMLKCRLTLIIKVDNL